MLHFLPIFKGKFNNNPYYEFCNFGFLFILYSQTKTKYENKTKMRRNLNTFSFKI